MFSVSNILDCISQLWRLTDDPVLRAERLGPSPSAAESIQDSLSGLHHQIRALRVDDCSQYVRVTSLAMELVLRLCWPSELDLTALAGELKDALCTIPVRACSYMDVTSFQLMVGAVAAQQGSQTRAWFFARLKRALLAVRSQGWDEPLELFTNVYISNIWLRERFQALWHELGALYTS